MGIFAAVLTLVAYDVMLRHGVGMQHFGAALNAFCTSIGSWVFFQ